jgi:hypothetical protein
LAEKRFRRGGKKIRIHTTKGRIPDKATAPVYAEGVNMLEGLTEQQADIFLQENPTLVPLSRKYDGGTRTSRQDPGASDQRIPISGM